MAPKFAANIHTEDANFLSAPININTIGSNTIIAGISGDVISVYRLILVAGSSNTITFLDGVTPLSGPVFLAADQGLFFRFDTKPWFDTSPSNSFNISLASANVISGVLYYTVRSTGGAAAIDELLLEDDISALLLEDNVDNLQLES